MNYKDIMEQVIEIDKDFVVVHGVSDVINKTLPFSKASHFNLGFYFKDLKDDSFWKIIGRGENESVVESLNEFECDVEVEGEYEFKAILRWIPGDYDEYGRCTLRDYLEVEHIEFNLIQTFQQREREVKLDTLFDLFEN